MSKQEALTAIGIMALAFIFVLGMLFIEHVSLRLFAPPPFVTDGKGHKISINADSKTWQCDNGQKNCWFMTMEGSK